MSITQDIQRSLMTQYFNVEVRRVSDREFLVRCHDRKTGALCLGTAVVNVEEGKVGLIIDRSACVTRQDILRVCDELRKMGGGEPTRFQEG